MYIFHKTLIWAKAMFFFLNWLICNIVIVIVNIIIFII